MARTKIHSALILCFALLAAVIPVAQAQAPVSSHVYVVFEENSNYSDIIGNGSMPYINSLASQYGLATNYYANTHPSIGNYFMMTTGQIITNDDAFTSTVSVDNIVRQLIAGGKTWKSYAESLPSVGWVGGNSGSYLARHNPASFLSDVRNSNAQKQNLVPFTQFATDMAAGTLPQFSFISPNVINDLHDGSDVQADNWLKNNIKPLIDSASFKQNDLLVIVFDESVDADSAHGGGHVAMLVVGAKVKSGYQSTTFYQHQSLLRMLSEASGLTTFPGAATTALEMTEFFTAAAPPPPPPPTPAPDFTLTATTGSQTVPRGQSATFGLSLAASNPPLSAPVTLTCSGLPTAAACSFAPNSVTLGASAVASTMTVTTSVTSASLAPLGTRGGKMVLWSSL